MGVQPVESFFPERSNSLHKRLPGAACPHRTDRRNGRPRAAFGGIECAMNCNECKPHAWSRYTLPDPLIPLTGGRFEGRILVVRSKCTGRCRFSMGGWTLSFCPLSVERPVFPVCPPRPGPSSDQTGSTIRNERFRESLSDFAVRDLAGQLLNNAPACLKPTASGVVQVRVSRCSQ